MHLQYTLQFPVMSDRKHGSTVNEETWMLLKMLDLKYDVDA